MSKITRHRGDTYSVDAKLSIDSIPVDFSAGNSIATFSFARGTKRVTIPGTNGNISGEVSFPFPADVTAGTYSYDIQVTSNTGKIRTFVKDTLELVSDITN